MQAVRAIRKSPVSAAEAVKYGWKEIGARSASTAAAAAEAKPQKKPKKAIKSESYVMNLFRGELVTSQLFPYPNVLTPDQQETVASMIDPVNKLFTEVNNQLENDRLEKVEDKTWEALWDIGAFALQVPEEWGGIGLNNTQYGRIVEIVGASDLGVGITLGAHQSIGFKGILLVGTPEQKKKYLPRVTGQDRRDIAAFCLTEPTHGSDAQHIRSRAELSPDGKHWILNGSKIWISGGGLAEIMTVFAQTPVKDEATGQVKDRVTAFIVERSFGGVTSGPPEKKMGIKCSNTTEVYYDNVKVPVENVLGGVGNGFKVAMSILNNGRFGMAAAMAGAIKSVAAKATDFAVNREQFGKTINNYGMIQEKLARMATLHYVTESLAYMISGNMDRGSKDYHLEAAISKVFGSEAAWEATDEAIQVMGGMGYMRDTGLELKMRDLRVFRVFEGANDTLRLFVALTGIQFAGNHLMSKGAASVAFGLAHRYTFGTLGVGGPSLVPLVHPELADAAKNISKLSTEFGGNITELIIKYKKNIVEEQFLLAKVAECTIDLYTSAVVLSRATNSLNTNVPSAAYEVLLTKLWCDQASARIENNLRALTSARDHNNYAKISAIAKEMCKNGGLWHEHPLKV